MKKVLVLLTLLLAACACTAQKPPPAQHQKLPPQIVAALHEAYDPPLDPEVFETFSSAATYAIAMAYEFTNVFESAGVVVIRSDMKFQVTKPVTENSGDSVGIPMFKRPGYVVVADYHTHPCLPYTHFVRWFSPEDIEEVEQEGGSSVAVMGDLCSGNVNVWSQGRDPVGDHLVHNFDGSPTALTTGHVVGHIEITKEPKILEQPEGKHTEIIGE